MLDAQIRAGILKRLEPYKQSLDETDEGEGTHSSKEEQNGPVVQPL